MKTIYRLTIAALAAATVLCSCTKDGGAESGGTPASRVSGGPRVITLSYGASTKAVMDGLDPKFTAGDRILVSDGVETQTCAVSVSGDGVASITTILEGTLKAVYPADAAVVSGGTITGVMPPAVQSGRLADAIVGIAENIPQGATSATFDISAAILRFYVDESIGVKRITVTSTSENISTKGKTITVGGGGSTLDAVTDDPDKRVCYAAVPKDINAGTLTFTSETTTQGTVTRRSPSTATLAVRKIYNAFIPYYVEVNGIRWGYCNVDAFYPEDLGLHYAWGAVDGQAVVSGWDFAEPFDWPHAPFNNGNASYNATYFNSVRDTECPGGILASHNDVAAVSWGGEWRMPTKAELDLLLDIGTYGASRGWNGATFNDGGPESIFLPVGGYGGNNYDYERTREGFYWTSQLSGADDRKSNYLHFTNTDFSIRTTEMRFSGMLVRPVYGPLPPTTTLGLTIDPLTEGGTY